MSEEVLIQILAELKKKNDKNISVKDWIKTLSYFNSILRLTKNFTHIAGVMNVTPLFL